MKIEKFNDRLIAFDFESEIWKNIPNYEGLYQASNLGRIKSFVLNEKILNPSKRNDGYYKICLNYKSYLLHRVILLTFKPNVSNLPQINHKNGNKNDNRVDNLEWCDQFYNMKHCYEAGLRNKLNQGRLGKFNNKAREVIQYSLNGEYISKYDTIREAAIKLSFNEGNICRCVNGQLKHYKKYIWK
jgi:hypothetical protein